jgi:hypothetical protein
MKRLLLAVLGALGLLVGMVTMAGSAQAAPHEVTSNPIVCTLNPDQTVTCAGGIAGLGTGAVIITTDVAFACETRSGSNQPGGHLQAVSAPIQPRSGRVNFNLTTGPADCPPGLNPVVGDTATITVRSAATGEVLFTTTVPITEP